MIIRRVVGAFCVKPQYQMCSIVNVYVVNRSNKGRKCVSFSCSNCHFSFKYFSRKKVKTCRQEYFNISQIYRAKGKFSSK